MPISPLAHTYAPEWPAGEAQSVTEGLRGRVMVLTTTIAASAAMKPGTIS
jgi:hypothetical protein